MDATALAGLSREDFLLLIPRVALPPPLPAEQAQALAARARAAIALVAAGELKPEAALELAVWPPEGPLARPVR